MRVKKLFLAAILSIGLVGCSSNEDDLTSASTSQSTEVKTVSVSIAGLSTKSSSATDIVTSETKNVESILINLTDANNNVLVSKLINKSNSSTSDWHKLIREDEGLKFINISGTVAKVFVYGNPGTAINRNVISTTLANQQGSEVLYFGVDDDLTLTSEPVSPRPTEGKTYIANVTIEPIVARLQIKKIEFNRSGSFEYSRKINDVERRATVRWTAFSGKLKGVYLNDVYHKYQGNGALSEWLSNYSYVNKIRNGEWLFTNPNVNAHAYASYRYYLGGTYRDLPLTPASGKCYGFNFFPGDSVPKLHLDLNDLYINNLTSTNTEVFNPALKNTFRFANIVKYYKNRTTEMTAADFKPGTIYNMEIELIPALDSDLHNVQYNAIVNVTIAPWGEQTLRPGLELNQ